MLVDIHPPPKWFKSFSLPVAALVVSDTGCASFLLCAFFHECLTVLSLCRSEEFAKKGCKVWATSRRIETIEPFSLPNIDRFALDVTDDESVKKAVDHIIEVDGKIDILINNAGAMAAGRHIP